MDATRAILVVDGSESMAAMLRHFLQQQGVDVWTAESLPAAKTLLAQHLFDVVLTDLFLPHRDGLRLLQYVRHVAPHTRVVMMVAFGTPDLHQHLLAEGAYACIVKPFRLQQLWHVLLQTWSAVSPQPEPPEPPPTPMSTPAHDASDP
jgi:DNA-binding NtrC family response regulator